MRRRCNIHSHGTSCLAPDRRADHSIRVTERAVTAPRLTATHSSGSSPRSAASSPPSRSKRSPRPCPPSSAPLPLVLAYGGLRWGKAVALRRRRIDVIHGRIEVAEAATEINGELSWRTPKSHQVGAVHLRAFVADALERHLDEWVGAKAIQAQLRHSSIQITFEVYGHLFPGHLDSVMDRLDRLHRRSDGSRTERRRNGPDMGGLGLAP